VDSNPRIISERLVDESALSMGMTAENLHDRFPRLTKERADAYAAASQEKYAKALADGRIQPDLVPVAVRGGLESQAGPGWSLATADEPPRPGTTLEALAALKTPFRVRGRVTAAEDVARELGLPVGMRLVSYAFTGVEPEVMGFGPVPATEKALASAGLSIDQIGL